MPFDDDFYSVSSKSSKSKRSGSNGNGYSNVDSMNSSNSSSYSSSSQVPEGMTSKGELIVDLFTGAGTGAKAPRERRLIKKFEFEAKKLVNKSIVLYGESGSGKTTVVKHYLYELKDEFPSILIFCMTNDANDDYSGIVPNCLIHTEIDENIIKTIYERQKEATQIFNVANKEDNLIDLYKKIGSPSKHNLDELYRKEKNVINRIRHNSKNMDIIDVNDKIKEIKEEFKKLRKDFYRKHIHNKRNYVKKNYSHLSEAEKITYKNLYFNPKMIIIFDDCMTQINEVIKKDKTKSLEKFFFMGRHVNITTVYTMQSITKEGLTPAMRNNAFYTVFAAEGTSNAFHRKSDSFSPLDKKNAAIIAEKVFHPPDGCMFYKLIYCKNEVKNKYQYILADRHESFTMGSPALWKFCKKIEKNKKDLEKQVLNKSKMFRT